MARQALATLESVTLLLGSLKKRLIQVHTNESDLEMVRRDPSQFYCLDLEAEGMESVLAWAEHARRVAPFENRRPPVIFVIGPGRPLKPVEIRSLNTELLKTGTQFYRRPKDASSFKAAMESLGEELLNQYESVEPVRKKAAR